MKNKFNIGHVVNFQQIEPERLANPDRPGTEQGQAAASPKTSLVPAHLSALTGIPNLQSFESDLDALFGALRPDFLPFCVCFLDLDDLKALNLRIGHDEADHLIRALAASLVQLTRHRAQIYHRSGDEFLAILQNTRDDEALLFWTRIISSIRDISFRQQRVTVSVGIAQYSDNLDSQSLRKRANDAMYMAKAVGKGRASVWSESEAGHAAAVGTAQPGNAPDGASHRG